MKKTIPTFLVLLGFVAGNAFVVVMERTTPWAQAQEDIRSIVPWVEFQITFQNCTYVHTGGTGVPGALSCTPR